MNDLNPNPASTEDLAEQVACLRRQSFTLLIALIVVTGTLTVYLYRQSSLLGYDLKNVRPQHAQAMANFAQNQKALEQFTQQLNAYAVAHPDFQPVLRKYGWVPPATPAAAAPKK